MLTTRMARGLLVSTVLMVAATGSVEAGIFQDAAYGLAHAGFTIGGRHNVLSGGVDLLAVNNFDSTQVDLFRNNVFDGGPWDVELDGPLSLSVSTTGRGLDQLDIALRTAVDSRATATPLSYLFNYDAGAQSTTIEGSIYLDSSLSINKLGFYDFVLDYSSRQLVDRDGRYSDDRSSYDDDIGPINISGNIYADLLALVTQPLFEAAGYENPFANFSGAARLTSLFDGLMKSDSTGVKVAGLTTPLWSDSFFLPQADMMTFSSVSSMPDTGGRSIATVPEPTVLVLMVAGASVVLLGRRHAHP